MSLLMKTASGDHSVDFPENTTSLISAQDEHNVSEVSHSQVLGLARFGYVVHMSP